MFKLAIPIIIQNLLSAAVNSSDVIMLNYVDSLRRRQYHWQQIILTFCLWYIMDWAQEHPFCVHSTLARKTCRRSMP